MRLLPNYLSKNHHNLEMAGVNASKLERQVVYLSLKRMDEKNNFLKKC